MCLFMLVHSAYSKWENLYRFSFKNLIKKLVGKWSQVFRTYLLPFTSAGKWIHMNVHFKVSIPLITFNILSIQLELPIVFKRFFFLQLWRNFKQKFQDHLKRLHFAGFVWCIKLKSCFSCKHLLCKCSANVQKWVMKFKLHSTSSFYPMLWAMFHFTWCTRYFSGFSQDEILKRNSTIKRQWWSEMFYYTKTFISCYIFTLNIIFIVSFFYDCLHNFPTQSNHYEQIELLSFIYTIV